MDTHKKSLRVIACSVKIWTCILGLFVLICSIKMASFIGPKPIVISTIVCSFLLVGLMRRQTMLARRAVRNGQLAVIKRTFKKSIRLSVLSLALFLVIFAFQVPRVKHLAHEKFKEMREHEKEHQEFKEFMKGQKEMENFMVMNPPPMFDYSFENGMMTS